ncbi:MAG: lamin tail domain-containing protein [bacterium]
MMKTRFLNLTLATIMGFVGGCGAELAAPVQAPLAGTLFLNEFMASNRKSIADEAGDYDDWVELYNAGDSVVQLRAMYLTDDLSVPMKWVFPDTFIAPKGYLLVWCDGEFKEGRLHTSFKLNASGEQLGLYWTDGNRLGVVDIVSFGIQGRDTSFGRLPDGGSWAVMPFPAPGGLNRSGVSSLNGVLFINEFMASNQITIADEFGDYDDRIELYNAGDSTRNLSGMSLTDDLSVPTKWTCPAVTIPAHGFLLIWAENEPQEGQLHATFNLAAVQGEQVGLYEIKDGHHLVIDTLSFGPQHPDTSFGRIPDGGAEWRFMSSPTPGRRNGGIRR